jgi:hypothetical protein
MNDQNKFDDYISKELGNIEMFDQWIRSGKTPKDRILSVRRNQSSILVGLTVAYYSNHSALEDVKNILINTVGHIYESWDGFWKLKGRKGVQYNQYILSAYDEMLWMLSLGFLLEIPENEFLKLVHVIDRDDVRDNLFEFIIRAKLPDRKLIGEESYRDFFGVPKCFEKLRQAISEPDNLKVESLIKEFITKEWYKNHKDAAWFDSHKSKHNTYFGYWSFETAAVVLIKGLDDSSFRDCPYYPKDLVDFARSKMK